MAFASVVVNEPDRSQQPTLRYVADLVTGDYVLARSSSRLTAASPRIYLPGQYLEHMIQHHEQIEYLFDKR
jgi:hypothetical protein